jgi:hypothetical protein
MKCLMLSTKDNKKFFTDKKNLPELLEFSKLFGIEISEVKIQDAEILELDQLAIAFCVGNFSKKPLFEVTEIKNPKSKKTRDNILSQAKQIKSFIKEEFLKGNPVCIQSVMQEFGNVTRACICMHLRTIIKELTAMGENINKIKHGIYILSQ